MATKINVYKNDDNSTSDLRLMTNKIKLYDDLDAGRYVRLGDECLVMNAW